MSVKKKPEDENEPTQAPADEPEADDDETEAKPDPDEPPPRNEEDAEKERQSRAEKKRERGVYRKLYEEERAAREAMLQQHAEQLRQLSERLAPPKQEAPPEDKELEEADRAEAALVAEWNARQGNVTPQQAEDFQRRARAVQVQRQKALIKVAQREMAPSPEQEQARRTVEAITSRHPDVMNDERARTWFEHRYAQLVQAEKKPNHVTTLDLAAAETRERFGLGQRAAPSQSRLTGIPASGGQGASGRGGDRPLTKEEKMMMNAAFSHLPENQRERAFRKEILGGT